ncbi:hypothetical protein [uncultured Jannaschia sp.]|uniref:hypothetical protein n=1 Tax=uncultured Jannaschia sp. TaxID=293347 RepID=UPI00262C5958|nr:hypothetical protein [uncultured Jannaschia sp.]
MAVATPVGHRTGSFIATKEHRRFIEFATAVRRYCYIGLCFGPAGVGKALSTRRLARRDVAEPLLITWGPRDPSDTAVYAAFAQGKAAFYTPAVSAPASGMRGDLDYLIARVEECIDLRAPTHQ